MKAVLSLSLLLSFIFISPNQAFAYLDPGTGSVILQVVAAGILGALFTIKAYWHRILSFFKGKKGPSDS